MKKLCKIRYDMKLRKGLMANKPRNVLKREEYEILALKNVAVTFC